MEENPARALGVLFRVASAVQAAFRRSRHSPHRGDLVAMGADGSPTEEIDRVAENVVLAALDREGVDWNVLSEEIGAVRRGGERTLVLDPIDGSHNALRGLPFATVSLGLGNDSLASVDVGVVHDLYRGLTYWAVRGEGAYRDGRRLSTRSWKPNAEVFLVNLGRYSTARAVALAGRGRRVRSLGCASLEMVSVAQGSADAYLFENNAEERNLRITDIAAGYRILLEAGGGVTDSRLESLGELPLDLHRHTSVFAFGDPALAAAAQGEGLL